MSFTDPTSGAGYAFGQILPSAHMTQIADQSGKAIDGDAGGTYTPSADIIFTGANSVQWGASRYPKLAPRTVPRLTSPVITYQTAFGAPDWVYTSAGLIQQSYVDVTGANIPDFITPIDNVVDQGTIASVTALIQGVGHGGTLPAVLPKLKVFRVNVDGTTTQLGSTATAAPGSAAIYDGGYELTVGSLSETVDAADGERYQVQLLGEGGANSNTVNVLAFRVSATVTILTP